EQNPSLQAAVARTLTRSMALYFSRPVRLFRPSKISGWQSLRSLAEHQGVVYDHKFLLSAVKLQGFGVFSKHFFPPMVVNTMLGTVLWTTYAKTSIIVEPLMQDRSAMAAAVSGGIAGGIQALVAAPAENLRLAIQGGTSAQSWMQAWRSMMRSTSVASRDLRATQLKEFRETRKWMQDVSEMAGRSWNGWGWGCAKDMCAFSAFFAIFEITRRVGQATKARVEYFNTYYNNPPSYFASIRQHTPRILNSLILVSGGVMAGLAYEIICRPWDKARRLIHVANRESKDSKFLRPVYDVVRNEGVIAFFRVPSYESTANIGLRSRVTGVVRTLGRVGPWGLGFLVWEMYGPGLA
ncbi:hypothetical protein AN958_04215, partial [Leucoagaricus sp. SymC.cos]